MVRLWLGTLALWIGILPTKAADPSQVFQQFFGAIQQLSEQQRHQKRQQTQEYTYHIVNECKLYREPACQEIIRATGMPSAANFIGLPDVSSG